MERRARRRVSGGPGPLVMAYYGDLFKAFGPQRWWPARTRFEVVVGAILTQNTAWVNVEKAIKNLRGRRALDPARLHGLDTGELASLIRPAGYFNVKAARLKNFTGHLFERHGGSLSRLFHPRSGNGALREELLGINGIGPETADSIILYAAGRPEFVVDAYTRRVFSRHGLVDKDATYDEIKAVFMENLPADAPLFNEYHALIVRVGKDYCRPSVPACSACPLGARL